MGRAQGANQGRDAVMNLGSGPLGGVLLGAGTPSLRAIPAEKDWESHAARFARP